MDQRTRFLPTIRPHGGDRGDLFSRMIRGLTAAVLVVALACASSVNALG